MPPAPHDQQDAKPGEERAVPGEIDNRVAIDLPLEAKLGGGVPLREPNGGTRLPILSMTVRVR